MGNVQEPAHKTGIELIGIKFYYAGGKNPSSAIPVHKPTSPEFPLLDRATIAYPATGLAESGLVNIMCCFKNHDGEALSGNLMLMRAVLKHAETIVVPPTVLVFQSDSPFSNIDNDYGFVPMQMDTKALFPAVPQVAVLEVDLNWEWKFNDGPVNGRGEDWEVFAYSKLELYLTLSQPLYPWVSGSTAGLPNYFPASVGLIRHACKWTQKAKNSEEAAGMLMMAIIEKTALTYAEAPAYSTYASDPMTGCPYSPDVEPLITIHATAWDERLRGMGGPSALVNCVDLSHLLMLLGNILGCGIRVGRLENSADRLKGFETNSMTPLRCGPVEGGTDFRYHEVAYIGDAFTADALVYDPCFGFPGPDGKLEYALGWPLSKYRGRLAQNPDDCNPQHYYAQEIIRIS